MVFDRWSSGKYTNDPRRVSRENCGCFFKKHDCCHLLVFLSSQKMKLTLARQQDRFDRAATKARGVWRNASTSLPALGRLDKAENNACNGDFWWKFCCSISVFHSNFVVRLCQLLLSRALRPWLSLFRCYSVSLCVHLTWWFGHLPALFLAQTLQNSYTCACQNGPVLPDGFIEWVVLREARSPWFTWG